MSGEKQKVLIVDDEYSFCKNLKTFLVKEGFDVQMTTNGEQALDMIRDEKPDLMTLDIRMPGMNGYEVLEKLRFDAKDLAVIVVSAIDIPDMEDRLMHAGAKAVVHKPVDLKLLLDTIKKIAAEKRE
ncbi:MAG: response regulator [Nitrospinae bacterium]|nr:response regulator [Nitrospinota bacterium]